MPVTAGAVIGGALDFIGGLIAPAAAAAPEVAAAAAPEAAAAATEGAIALPEIAVTAAAPEVAAGAGAGLGADVGLGALGAGALGADLTGGFGAGAEALGLGGTTAADLTGGAVTGAAPLATEGVSAVAPTTGAALGGATAGGVPSDVLAGTTGPLSALDTGGGPSTFDQLWQSDVNQFAPGSSADLTQAGGPAQSFAATTEPQFTNAANPLASIPGGGDVFANAPPGVVGGTDFGTALQAGGALPSGTDPSLAALPINLPSDVAAAPLASATNLASAASPAGLGTAAPPAVTEASIGGFTGGAGGGLPAGTSLETAGGGGGISGTLSNIFSSSGIKTAAMLAPLAGLGVTLAKGQPGVPPAEQTALNQANVVGGFGQNQLQLANANQITPAQAAQISTYVQNAKNQLYQQIANSGQGDPTKTSDWVQGVQQIEQQAVAMQQQFINSMITNGLAATGQADATLQAAANQQVASDAAFQSALTSSLSSFGLVAAISSKA